MQSRGDSSDEGPQAIRTCLVDADNRREPSTRNRLATKSNMKRWPARACAEQRMSRFRVTGSFVLYHCSSVQSSPAGRLIVKRLRPWLGGVLGWKRSLLY